MDQEELLRNIREKMGDDFVSIKDLERPTSDFMMNYFLRVLTECGVDIKKINEEIYQECFKDVITYVQVYNAIRGVFPIPSLLKDFSILSLIEPKVADLCYVNLMDNLHDFVMNCVMDYLRPNQESLFEKRAYLEKRLVHMETLKRNINDAAATRGKLESQKVREKCAKLKAEGLAASENQKVLVAEWEPIEALVATKRHLLNELQSKKEIRTRLEIVNKEFGIRQVKLATQEGQLNETSSLMHQKSSSLATLEEVVAVEKHFLVASTSAIDLGKSLLLEQNTQRQLEEQKAVLDAQLEDSLWQVEATQTSITALETAITEIKAKLKAIKNEISSIEQAVTDLELDERETKEDFGLKDVVVQTLERRSELLHKSIPEMENEFVQKYGDLQREYTSVHSQINEWVNLKIKQTK